jgi:hypothetical protein
MIQLQIPFININTADDLSVWKAGMLDLPAHPIACLNWREEFPSQPKVSFKIAHNGEYLAIHYFVEESELLAEVGADFGPVWTDSCVEFFVSFDNFTYYNAEFSCIGKALVNYHPADGTKIEPDSQIMSKIKRLSSLGDNPFGRRVGGYKWNLLVLIPAEIYASSGITSFNGLKASANFYKCGDNLTIPHFLSWMPIDSLKPNFHLPAFFGGLIFE